MKRLIEKLLGDISTNRQKRKVKRIQDEMAQDYILASSAIAKLIRCTYPLGIGDAYYSDKLRELASVYLKQIIVQARYETPEPLL